LERRRLPRLNLGAEQFRLSSNGKVFSVIDLSIDGMALRILDRDDFILFPVASEVAGSVNLKGEKYPVKARVKRVGFDQVGFEFFELDSETRTSLDRFLDPAELGRELKPMPTSEGSAVWYTGSSGTDLLFWRAADGQYRRLSLYVLGTFIQWDRDAGLSTGKAQSSSSPSEVRGVVRFETMLLNPDEVADPGKLKIAKTLILSSNLPQDLKRWCSRQLGGTS
jgi:hypothetical protein